MNYLLKFNNGFNVDTVLKIEVEVESTFSDIGIYFDFKFKFSGLDYLYMCVLLCTYFCLSFIFTTVKKA